MAGDNADRQVCAAFTQANKLFANVRAVAFDQMNLPHGGDGDRNQAFELLREAGHIATAMEQAACDPQAIADIRHDRIRPLTGQLREFVLRHHLMLIQPVWGWPLTSDQAAYPSNSVAWAGGSRLLPLIDRACHELGLSVNPGSRGFGAGQRRWNQLRASSVGVFDLGSGDARDRASACYALGCALVLGVYPVIVTGDDTPLPFDIDIEPLRLSGTSDDGARLRDAIDEATYAVHTPSGNCSVARTMAQVRKELPNAFVPVDLNPRDVQTTRLTLQLCLDEMQGHERALVTPLWPAFYPDGERRLFHVMPFSKPWSNDVRDAAASACRTARVHYRRGDNTDEQNVVHAIWREIATASHVLVDLSDLNENVALELGLAHALGRPVLMVCRYPQIELSVFREIEKLRIHSYADVGLARVVGDWL